MKSNQQIAIEVLMGKWGNGRDRVNRLTAAGYNASAIQKIVDCLVNDGTFPDTGAGSITGTEMLEVEFDTSKYNSICVSFVNGAEDPDNSLQV